MMVKLGEICSIKSGYAFKSECFSTNGVPIIRISNITANGVDVDYSVCYDDAFWIENPNYRVGKGDILVAMSGATVGKACINNLDVPLLLNQRVASITCDCDVTQKYVYHIINSNLFLKYVIENSAGCAQPNISVKQLADFRLSVPDAPLQRQIVSALDELDYIVNARKQQLSKLDELVKSRFIELFGMPGSDDFGWGLIPLGNACHINPKKSQDVRLVSGLEVSFVPMPAVTERGEIDATAIKEYDEVKTGFTYFTENDVLFAKITPCMENGKGAVARGLYNGIGFGSTEFHVLRPISGKTNPYWLYMLTAFPQFREDASNNMTGSAGQRRVPASFLENYRVAVPPMELQEQFAVFVEQVDKSKLYSEMGVAA